MNNRQLPIVQYVIDLYTTDNFHEKIDFFIKKNNIQDEYLKTNIYNQASTLKNVLATTDETIRRITSYIKYHDYENELYDPKFGYNQKKLGYKINTILLNMWR
jgi:hypothetical protein